VVGEGGTTGRTNERPKNGQPRCDGQMSVVENFFSFFERPVHCAAQEAGLGASFDETDARG
jgi:hypothetical protein